ncbi:YfiT family bacillithiol transferase [Flexithrix dorotheae]|uniref:YfiT family bacillithiol transferase n=1 Tax=Flexithrix dorotheae TaxID=70993 RepID=UPI0003803736|nr:bacillithiol transferase BstA [Flexithrix dorotheae]
MENQKYPIGQYQYPGGYNDQERKALIAEIEDTPKKLYEAVAGLSEKQLDTPYRIGGWSVRQVVHHLPDSHLNSFARFKLALTEDCPQIKAYNEAAWATLCDYKETPLETSLKLLECLHQRWVILLRSLQEDDFKKRFYHPENGTVSLDYNLGLYAWHGKHHIAHITSLRERMKW